MRKNKLFGFLFGFLVLVGIGCKKSDIKKTQKPNNLTSILSGNINPLSSVNGVGGYNLDKTTDRIFAFDYEHSGKLDYFVCYRPAYKTIWILKNINGVFTPVFKSFNGIGGYNLDNVVDKAFAYDYEHTGKLDHIVLYRAGSGIVWILKNTNGVFTPVYKGFSGIGGYNLDKDVDQIFAYDYEHSGKLDYLVCYRPWHGIIWILKNTNAVFNPVFKSSNGIAGYLINESQKTDKAFAFDNDHDGKLDDIVFYNNRGVTAEGLGKYFFWTETPYWIISQNNNNFEPTFNTMYGEFGYDISFMGRFSKSLAFDYEHSGKLDYLIIYQSGYGVFTIKKNNSGALTSIFESIGGVGGFNLKDEKDEIIAFDYEHSGKMDYLVCYRPGSKIIWILKNTDGVFTQVL